MPSPPMSAFLDCAKTMAQFAPVPWLAPAVGLLNTFLTMINQAQANEYDLGQLQNRCVGFLTVIYRNGDRAPPPEQQRLTADAESTLRNIIGRMEKWCKRGFWNRLYIFIRQDDLAVAIQRCHTEINDSLARLQLTAALDTAIWQSKIRANNERDKAEILGYLSDIKNTQSIIEMTEHQESADIRAMMALMQQHLSNTPGLGTNLYQVSKSTGKLLANMRLQRGEARRVGQYPVGGTSSMDIWEGLYLNEEKVAIKILRAVHSTPRSLERFKSEVDIWHRVWEIDQGHHILPLYGFCENDGPFPYVVSPWPQNGTADKYVALFPNVDHLALIRGIGAGICVLHSMNPPIAHGELKGANISINAAGHPLIADFGFSRIVEDITGVPFSQTIGASNDQRWLAPELCFGTGRLTLAADVYAFGMTMLELMTHAVPWAAEKYPAQVIKKVALGEKPPRPRDEASIKRGLNDHLWQVMRKCWDAAEDRPTMTEIVEML